MRDFGADKRLSRYIPHSFIGMLLAAVGAIVAGVIMIAVSTEPAAFVAGASLLRIGAVAGSLVIWWRWSSATPDEMDEFDDE
jgi:hypothetical protein